MELDFFCQTDTITKQITWYRCSYQLSYVLEVCIVIILINVIHKLVHKVYCSNMKSMDSFGFHFGQFSDIHMVDAKSSKMVTAQKKAGSLFI